MNDTFSNINGNSNVISDDVAPQQQQEEPMISISDPIQALLQLVALVLILMAVGCYIVVFKPGVPSQGLRALAVPNHPGVSAPEDVMAALAQTLG